MLSVLKTSFSEFSSLTDSSFETLISSTELIVSSSTAEESSPVASATDTADIIKTSNNRAATSNVPFFFEIFSPHIFQKPLNLNFKLEKTPN